MLTDQPPEDRHEDAEPNPVELPVDPPRIEGGDIVRDVDEGR